MKIGIVSIITFIMFFITGCSTDIESKNVLDEFYVNKNISKDNYLKMSESNKNIIDEYIVKDMQNIYDCFINEEMSLSEAFIKLSNYSEFDNISGELDKLESNMTVISESKINYMKAKEELKKSISYITLENAIAFYEKVEPISEYYIDSRQKLVELDSQLLNLSKNNKINNILDRDLLSFFKSTDPERIIREYDIGITKEKYIYESGKYLMFENEILVDEGINQI